MSRVFFSLERAVIFTAELRKRGITSAAIWTSRDAFGQTIYTVRW